MLLKLRENFGNAGKVILIIEVYFERAALLTALGDHLRLPAEGVVERKLHFVKERIAGSRFFLLLFFLGGEGFDQFLCLTHGETFLHDCLCGKYRRFFVVYGCKGAGMTCGELALPDSVYDLLREP